MPSHAQPPSKPHANTPGVVAPPPLIFLGFLAAALAVEVALPLPLRPAGVDPALGWATAGVLIVLGLMVFALGVGNFVRAGTPVPTREPARALVTTGIHGRSRNPIYVAMFLVYLGIGLLANTLWTIVLFAPLGLIIRYGVVAREEAYLEREFGDAYQTYKTRVRRWL